MERRTTMGTTTARGITILIGMVTLAGCTENHVRGSDVGTAAGDAGPIVLADAGPPAVDAPPLPDAPEPPLVPLLATCLADGRGLREIAVVDNNDTTDHGALLRFGLTPAGLLAAAGADGTLKLWTLDAELLQTFDGTILTYGPEIPAAPIADLAFDGERILAGDIRGIVLALTRDGGLEPVGGTTPEIPIRAVAFDPLTRRLAHAQTGDVSPLTVRAEDGTTVEVATDVLVSDLAFTASGALLVAGERAGRPVIETRDASLAVVLGADITFDVDGAFLEVALAPALGESAPRLGAVATAHVMLGGEAIAFEGGRSIALATDEASAFALVAGTQGLVVMDAAGTPGREVFRLAGDSVTVRVDATGTLAVLGGSDARIHVLACGE